MFEIVMSLISLALSTKSLQISYSESKKIKERKKRDIEYYKKEENFRKTHKLVNNYIDVISKVDIINGVSETKRVYNGIGGEYIEISNLTGGKKSDRM